MGRAVLLAALCRDGAASVPSPAAPALLSEFRSLFHPAPTSRPYAGGRGECSDEEWGRAQAFALAALVDLFTPVQVLHCRLRS